MGLTRTPTADGFTGDENPGLAYDLSEWGREHEMSAMWRDAENLALNLEYDRQRAENLPVLVTCDGCGVKLLSIEATFDEVPLKGTGGDTGIWTSCPGCRTGDELPYPRRGDGQGS